MQTPALRQLRDEIAGLGGPMTKAEVNPAVSVLCVVNHCA